MNPIQTIREALDAMSGDKWPENMRTALAALAELEAQQPVASDKATPGRWFVRKRERDGVTMDCFVAAPDCQGLAYDAEILGDDEYRDGIERKLADCELIVAAVNAYRAAPVAQQPQAEAVLRDVTDNWQQYAKGGETAQQCIERHRGEHDSLLTLLSASRAELGRAYRCIQAMHNALTAMQADIPGNGYHSPTIAAAKRFVWEGAIDGTDYFVGKPVAVLHAALALPKTLDAALAAAPKGQP